MSEDLKCRICGAPATIHLTQIINGKMKKIHLCEKCAAKHNAAEMPLIKFAEMITKKLFGEKLGKEILEGNVKSFSEKDLKLGKKCPHCGLSESELEKSERFGCPHCYEVFEKELSAILPKIQHANCAPAAAIPSGDTSVPAKNLSENPSVEDLEKILRSAVAKEDYLLAAKTRDKIAALKEAAQKPKRTRKSVATTSAKKPARKKAAGVPATKTPRKGKKQ